VTQVKTNGTTVETYGYDNGGRVTAITRGGTTLNLGYNTSDQVTAVTNGTDWVTYAHDANGSLTNRVEGGTTYSLAYNQQNKLSSVTVGGVTTSYLYNDSGIRVSSTSGGSTKLYLIDPNNHTGYAQILEELNTPDGTPTTSYVIGDDVLGQCGTTTTAPLYMLADGHGSTRQMANISGGVTSRYNYEAYGTMLGSSSGSPETSLRYCGEQFDSTLNMYNLRARFYDPVNGRFNARDSFMGNNEDPQSLHKYAYANCDPVNGIDPSGHDIYIIALIVLVIIVIAVFLYFYIPKSGTITSVQATPTDFQTLIVILQSGIKQMNDNLETAQTTTDLKNGLVPLGQNNGFVGVVTDQGKKNSIGIQHLLNYFENSLEFNNMPNANSRESVLLENQGFEREKIGIEKEVERSQLAIKVLIEEKKRRAGIQ
jgi:RHS repeat-associated protein